MVSAEVLLSDDEKNLFIGVDYEARSIKFRGLNTYVKKFEYVGDLLRELFSVEMAKYFDLNCVDCRYCIVGGNYYKVSTDLNNYGKFHLADSIVNDWVGYVPSIISNIESKFLDSENIIEDLIKMYMFDILFFNYDRHFGNWGVFDNNIYLLDNECLFDACFLPCLRFNEDHREVRDDDFELYIDEIKYDLDKFLNYVSDYYVSYFVDKLDLVTPDFVFNKLNEIISVNNLIIEDDDLDDIFDRYNMFYNSLKTQYFKGISKS